MKQLKVTMKKVIAGLLVTICAISMAGCTNNQPNACVHNYYLASATGTHNIYQCSECDKTYKEVLSNTDRNHSTDTNHNIDTNRTDEKAMTAVYLSSLEWFNRDSLYYDKAYDSTSNVGTRLTHAFRTGTMYHGGAGEGWVEYYLDGKYEKITGTLAVVSEFKDTTYEGFVEVYADGVLVHTTEVISGGSLPVEFEADISGCKILKLYHEGGEPFRIANVQVWK